MHVPVSFIEAAITPPSPNAAKAIPVPTIANISAYSAAEAPPRSHRILRMPFISTSPLCLRGVIGRANGQWAAIRCPGLARGAACETRDRNRTADSQYQCAGLGPRATIPSCLMNQHVRGLRDLSPSLPSRICAERNQPWLSELLGALRDCRLRSRSDAPKYLDC